MRTRYALSLLAAAAPSLLGCGGVIPLSHPSDEYVQDTLLEGLDVDPEEAELRLGESAAVTATLSRFFVRMDWAWDSAAIEVPGIRCEPVVSCALDGYSVDSHGTKHIKLHLFDTQKVIVRVDGVREGVALLFAVVFVDEPCGNPPADCGQYGLTYSRVRVRPAAR
jgi:hypothetical protein